jgi:hypothetical protein
VLAIGPVELGVAVLAELIASAAGISRAAAAGTGMRSEEVPGDTTGQAHAAAAVVALPVWDLAVVEDTVAVGEDSVAVVAAGGEGRPTALRQGN